MQYKYIGDGAGIAGLPHVVTDEEAAATGVTEILRAALENGSYVSTETAGGPTSPPRQIKKKEVMNG
jgi:hypothetical protein